MPVLGSIIKEQCFCQSAGIAIAEFKRTGHYKPGTGRGKKGMIFSFSYQRTE
jgi:hypothetical protein